MPFSDDMKVGGYVEQALEDQGPRLRGQLLQRQDADEVVIDAQMAAMRFQLSLVRKAMGRKAPITVVTEGSEVQPFHGRVVLLVDRHAASANEMLIAFARENKLATIVGEATPGRVLGGSKFRMPHSYWLALPVGAYQTTTGNSIEGKPILPDVLEPFDPEAARVGLDTQLERAIKVVSRL